MPTYIRSSLIQALFYFFAQSIGGPAVHTSSNKNSFNLRIFIYTYVRNMHLLVKL